MSRLARQLTGWTWLTVALIALLPTSAVSEQPEPRDEALIKTRREFLLFTMDKVGAPTLDIFTPDFAQFVRKAAREAAFGQPEPRRDQLLTHWAYAVRLRHSCEPTKDAAAARALAKRVAEIPQRSLLAAIGDKTYYAYLYHMPFWEMKWARTPRIDHESLATLDAVGKDYNFRTDVVRGTVRIRKIGNRWRVVFADYHRIMNADWASYRLYIARLLTARRAPPERLLSGKFDSFLVAHNVVGNFVGLGLSEFVDDPSKAICAYYRKDAPDGTASLQTRERHVESRAVNRVLVPISQWHTRQ